MSQDLQEDRTLPSRVLAVDAARGLAIVAMAVFHLFWDLSFLGYLGYDITQDAGWVGFQRGILGSFLFLVGVGLVLGHGRQFRARAFWRRWLLVAGGAVAISAGTFVAFGAAFSWFGVLHAIALFSIMAIPLLRLRAPTLFAVALLFLVPALYRSALFNTPALAWLGFFTEQPYTVDLVPIFPWFGVVVAGMAAARLAPWARIAAWRPRWLGPLALIGRWSLIIYVVHQPLIYGALMVYGLWFPAYPPSPELSEPLPRAAAFIAQCQPSCVESGGVEGYCTSYCHCAVGAIDDANLWGAVAAEAPTPQERSQLDGVITLCRAMAELPTPRR